MGEAVSEAVHETVKSAMRKTNARAACREGRLILVTCADIGRLDLVLRAAVRRMAASQTIELAEPVVTRVLPAGSGTLVSRSRFGAIDETGDIVLAWQDGGRSFGYTSNVVHMLERGSKVIAAAPSGCGADLVARSLWPDVVVVHLEPGTEKLRTALGSLASLHQTASPPTPDSIWASARDIRIRDLDNLTATVRALTTELERLCPKPVATETRPRPAAAEPSAPLRPGARSSLAAKNRRTPLKQPVSAPALSVAPQARAVSST
jgi:hypothetical protein